MKNPMRMLVMLSAILVATTTSNGDELFAKRPGAVGYRVFRAKDATSFVAKDYSNDDDNYTFTDRVSRVIARMNKKEILHVLPILLDEWKGLPESSVELAHHVGAKAGPAYSGLAPKAREQTVPTMAFDESEPRPTGKIYHVASADDGLPVGDLQSKARATYRSSARTGAKTKARTTPRSSRMPRSEFTNQTQFNIGSTATGIPMHMGPRGGMYHITSGGNRSYHSR